MLEGKIYKSQNSYQIETNENATFNPLKLANSSENFIQFQIPGKLGDDYFVQFLMNSSWMFRIFTARLDNALWNCLTNI